jgi:hypothetical protein
MRTRIYGLVLATLLVVGPALAGHAEEATTPPPAENPPAAATQTQSPPISVARPSIVPTRTEKRTEKRIEKVTAPPPSNEAAADAPPPRSRHYARRHDRRYASYWAPFPIYLPHLYHSRIVWGRLPWFSF